MSSFRQDDVIAPARALYAPWTSGDSGDGVARFLEARNITTIYVASGLIDPRRPPAELEAVNVILPRNVIAGARRSGCKVVTFGTIMEGLVGAGTGNAYVRSKVQLAEEIIRAAQAGAAVLHLRIHTLYGGGPPDPSMFLGQLLQAVKNGERFAMSPGEQLREYHHVEDDVNAIRVLVQSGLSGIVDLSHGQSVRLKDIATYVFGRLERMDLLGIGALPAPALDNYERLYARQNLLANVRFRDALPSIFEDLATWIKN